MKKAGLLLVVLFAVFIVGLNVVAWQPGVGGRRDKLPGTELERYFGWPATARADLWRSDDPSLVDRILRFAPFYWPQGEMQLIRRYTGNWAIIVDVAFGLLGAALVSVWTFRLIGPHARIAVTILGAIGLVICLGIAERVSTHL